MKVKFGYKGKVTEPMVLDRTDSIKDIMDALFEWGRAETEIAGDFRNINDLHIVVGAKQITYTEAKSMTCNSIYSLLFEGMMIEISPEHLRAGEQNAEEAQSLTQPNAIQMNNIPMPQENYGQLGALNNNYQPYVYSVDQKRPDLSRSISAPKKFEFKTESKPVENEGYEISFEKPQQKDFSAENLILSSQSNILKGIKNEGNTCFFNSLIQCLRVCDYESIQYMKKEMKLFGRIMEGGQEYKDITKFLNFLGMEELRRGGGFDSRAAFYQLIHKKEEIRELFKIKQVVATFEMDFLPIHIEAQSVECLNQIIPKELQKRMNGPILLPRNLILQPTYGNRSGDSKYPLVQQRIVLDKIIYTAVSVIDSTPSHAKAHVYLKSQGAWVTFNDDHTPQFKAKKKKLFMEDTFIMIFYKVNLVETYEEEFKSNTYSSYPSYHGSNNSYYSHNSYHSNEKFYDANSAPYGKNNFNYNKNDQQSNFQPQQRSNYGFSGNQQYYDNEWKRQEAQRQQQQSYQDMDKRWNNN